MCFVPFSGNQKQIEQVILLYGVASIVLTQKGNEQSHAEQQQIGQQSQHRKRYIKKHIQWISANKQWSMSSEQAH